MKKILFCISLMVAALTSCGDDVEDLYSHSSAYFVCQNTNTVPSLNSALNNMGEFATIVRQGSYFQFANLATTDKVNATALTAYSTFDMGVSGFIVGLPNIPEVGALQSSVVCFDRVCPNCYNDGIARALTLQAGGFAHCSRCTRTYNLNNGGLISNDTTGVKLMRYRVSYAPYTLTIRN